jgi:serine/threonine protein kinase
MCVKGQHINIVSELCTTDLHSILEEATSLIPPTVVKRFLKGIISGVAAVHTAGIFIRSLSLPAKFP